MTTVILCGGRGRYRLRDFPYSQLGNVTEAGTAEVH